MQMQLHDQVRMRREPLRDALWIEARGHARYPSADSTAAALRPVLAKSASKPPPPASPARALGTVLAKSASKPPAAASATKSRYDVVGSDGRRVGGRGNEKQRVVYDFSRARLEVNRSNPLLVREIQGQDHIAIEIGSFGRNVDLACELQLDIRTSKGPAFGKRRRRRRTAQIARRHPGRHPVANRCDFPIAQPAIVAEFRKALGCCRMPGRHEPSARSARDQIAPSLDLFVRCQRKRSGLTWTMTGDAMAVDDWCDIG